MKIIFSHFFTDKNKGDAAILETMIQSFKTPVQTINYKIATTQNISRVDDKLFYSFFYLGYYGQRGPIMKILGSSYVLLAATLWALGLRTGLKLNFILAPELKRTMLSYAECDAVVGSGGGYITGKNTLKGTLTVLFQLHAIVIPYLLRKPVYLYSQSIGPFGNRLQELISKSVLSNCCKKIFLREDRSVDVLKKIGVRPSLFTRSVDAAFGFKSNCKDAMKQYLAALGVKFEKNILGITLKKFLSTEKQKFYEKSFVTFIQKLASKEENFIVLIPQVTAAEHHDDDRIVSERVYRQLNPKNNVLLIQDDLDCFRLKGIYENLNYLIGTRTHSCIFSLTSYVPVIALEYEYKTSGIMKDLGLAEWVIKMQDVTAPGLENKFTQLKQNYAEYVHKLKTVLPPYIARHNEPAQIILNELAVSL